MEKIDLVHLKFRKIVDKGFHDILVVKMKKCGFGANAFRWIYTVRGSYLMT